MKWIVLEDKKAQTTFIAVVGVPETRKHSIENEICSYYKSKKEAIDRAILLKRETGAREIKVFIPEV